jgi:zinc protease
VQREIEGLAGERPVVGEELESILRNVTLRLPGRFETLAALESAVLDQVTYGYPADWWPTYGARARALGAEDLAAAATKVVHPEQLTWILVGDLAKVEAGIRELELGEITHLDASGAVVER